MLASQKSINFNVDDNTLASEYGPVDPITDTGEGFEYILLSEFSSRVALKPAMKRAAVP